MKIFSISEINPADQVFRLRITRSIQADDDCEPNKMDELATAGS